MWVNPSSFCTLIFFYSLLIAGIQYTYLHNKSIDSTPSTRCTSFLDPGTPPAVQGFLDLDPAPAVHGFLDLGTSPAE